MLNFGNDDNKYGRINMKNMNQSEDAITVKTM